GAHPGARARGRRAGAGEVVAAEEGDLVPAQAEGSEAAGRAEGEDREGAHGGQAEGRRAEEGDLALVRPQEGGLGGAEDQGTAPAARQAREGVLGEALEAPRRAEDRRLAARG